MKSAFIALAVILSIATLNRVIPAYAQTSSENGITCGSDTNFESSIEIVIDQLRSGFTYTATVIGLNSFDPVLAILNHNTSEITCSDNAPAAVSNTATLPSTGQVASSSLSAQVTFVQTGGSDSDTSLFISSIGGANGEFVLILEGMAVTGDDGVRDIYHVNLSPAQVASAPPVTIYMLSKDNSLVDPYIDQIDDAGNTLTDAAGNAISCDNAGSNIFCWGNSANLSTASVTASNSTLTGSIFDAMLSVSGGTSFNFALSTSPTGNTGGQYLLVFHVGSVRFPGAASSAYVPNWCEGGQAWGDGRCNVDDPWLQNYMWKAGWCHGMEEAGLLQADVEECIVLVTGGILVKRSDDLGNGDDDDEEDANDGDGDDGDGDE